jgi:hypothetical protein
MLLYLKYLIIEAIKTAFIAVSAMLVRELVRRLHGDDPDFDMPYVR